jgi:hypothetical protein
MPQLELDLFSDREPLTVDDLLARIGRHQWDRVGGLARRGGANIYTFRRGSTDELVDLAEGELPYWLAQLDGAAAALAKQARKQLAVLRYSRDAQKRSDAERTARSLARQITDVTLREAVYREIVAASTRWDETHVGAIEETPR